MRHYLVCSMIVQEVIFVGETTTNIIVLERSRVQIPCRPNEEQRKATFYWNHMQSPGAPKTLIFNGQQLVNKERYDNDTGRNHCDLIIKRAWITDAGIYECEVRWMDDSDRRSFITYLVVLGLFHAQLKFLRL